MEPLTIRDLRKQSGLSMPHIIEQMRQVDTDVPRRKQGLNHIETKGTTKMSVIKALASTFNLPLEVVDKAAKHTREQYLKKVSKKSA